MIKVKKLDNKAIIPTRAYPTDAGLDLYAIESKWLWGWSGHGVVKFRTGIALEIPGGFYGKIFDRSSIASKGIITIGGVIDSSYRGEIIVCLYNLGRDDHLINIGDKIAQLIIQPCELITPIEVEELSETKRDVNGFGSTGK